MSENTSPADQNYKYIDEINYNSQILVSINIFIIKLCLE